MDSQGFKQLVRETVVLSDDRKEYYIAQSDGYIPEMRDDMAAIIREEEQNLKITKEKKHEEKRKQQASAHNRLRELEQQEDVIHLDDEKHADEVIRTIIANK